MKMKKIFLIFICLITIWLVFDIGIILLNNYRVLESIKKFEPFSENNSLLKLKTSLKIETNLPKIEAASAFYPFAADLVQNIYSEDLYSSKLLKMVSTSQAFSDIIDGKTDIIIATEPSDEQREEIQKSNVELQFKKIYLEPLAIILNKNNSIENLNIEQIQRIYYNDSSNWTEFGGNNTEIHTYQLEKNNGSQTCFENIVKNNTIGKNNHEINIMPKIIDKVGLDKNGIGYAFYSYYSKMYNNKNVKTININNTSIKSEDYPLLFEVYLIYRTDNSNNNIQKIINWLESDEGKNFIKVIV